jgi:hypothetical protein
VTLLLIGSSHAPLDVLCAASLHNFRFFSILLVSKTCPLQRGPLGATVHELSLAKIQNTFEMNSMRTGP